MVAGAGVMPALAEIVYTPANCSVGSKGGNDRESLTDMAFVIRPVWSGYAYETVPGQAIFTGQASDSPSELTMPSQ